MYGPGLVNVITTPAELNRSPGKDENGSGKAGSLSALTQHLSVTFGVGKTSDQKCELSLTLSKDTASAFENQV